MKVNKKIMASMMALTLVGTTWNGVAKAEETQIPTQEWTLKTDGFENGNGMDLNKIGGYVSGVSNKDGGVAEIISYDSVNNRAWVVNGAMGMLDMVDMDTVLGTGIVTMSAVSLNVKELVEAADAEFSYGDMTSVSVNSEKGIAAVALQAAEYDNNGKVAILSTDGKLVALVEAGCQPDMVTFTPDGSKVLVANEGEPRKGFGEGVTDPAGSVTVIDVNYDNLTESTAVNVGFEAFDSQRDELLADGIMMVGGSMPSVDFEPEYIACDDDTAYVALQEANAIGVLDLESIAYTGVYSLGYKDLSISGNAIDLIADNKYEAKTYENVVSAYMPDGIALYKANGTSYVVTANEGDAREWGSDETEYVNETKATLTATDGTEAKKVRVIDSEVTDGLPQGKAVLYGGRSFSIYEVTENGLVQVYDSGNDFEKMTAEYIPAYFNCSNDDNEYDSRSPKKGIEPESVTVGFIDNKAYAFVALERVGGIMVYDVTKPSNSAYVNYINTRNFAENPDKADPQENPEFYITGDVAPEGLYFVNAYNGRVPMLLAAFEVSGTVAAYSIATVKNPNDNNQNDATDVVKGDVNGDKSVSLEDAQIVLKAALKIIKLNEIQTKAADVCQNGTIELEDAQKILKVALRIESL